MSSDAPEPAGRSRARRIAIPLVLLVGITLVSYGLARWHPFSRDAPGAGDVVLGDAAAGRQVFTASCASCHGAQAQGGVGPALAGSQVTPAQAAAVIRGGRGVMPAGLVSGQQESDVLAYLATISAAGAAPPAPPAPPVATTSPPAATTPPPTASPAAGGRAALTAPGLRGVEVVLEEPAPAGWRVWVQADGAAPLDAGAVANGAVTFRAADLGAGPLVADRDQVVVGRSAGEPALAATLPAPAVAALRSMYVSAAGTPGGVALVPGARAQMAAFAGAATLLVRAAESGDLAGARRQAEYVVNVVRGGTPRDLDGDGNAPPIGDGYGLVDPPSGGYVLAERAAAQQVLAAPGIDDGARQSARLADGAGRATERFLGLVVAASERLAATDSLAEARVQAGVVDAYDGRIVAGQERVAEYAPGMAAAPLVAPGG